MKTIQYPAKAEKDGTGYMVTFPDFPDAHTYGDTMEEALESAVGSLREVIAARIAHRKDIPEPSKLRGFVAVTVTLPSQTE